MEPRASGGGEDGEGEGDGGGGEISHMCESKGHRPLRAAAQKRKKKNNNETRPDTRQSSRGRLGKSSNAKTARNSKM